MKVGVIGLGKMGGPIARRLADLKHTFGVFDRDPAVRQEFKNLGITVYESISDLSAASDVIWVMVSASAVDDVLEHLCNCTIKGTVIIDGGNSNFHDTIRRAQKMEERKIHFLDCGTSGGLWGTKHGFSLTIGGNLEVFKKVEEVFKILAASSNAYAYVGPSGAGHYVKMIHNGIEYGLMEAYAEGFHLIHNGYYKNLDLAAISGTWIHGAVIRSFLLELIREIYLQDQNLLSIKGEVGQTGEGRWTVEEAHTEKIPVPVIEKSLDVRNQSIKTGGNYATKLIALMRHKMGGHAVKQELCEECSITK